MTSGSCHWYSEFYLWCLEDIEPTNDYGQIFGMSVLDKQTFITSGHLGIFVFADEAGAKHIAA